MKTRQFTGHHSNFHGNNGLDLATLTDLPRGNRFVEERNDLYRPSNDLDASAAADGAGNMFGPTEEEMKLLPKIKRQHITLTKFLGSGAFGEVFEGLAKGVSGYSDPQGTKVAVKVSSDRF